MSTHLLLNERPLQVLPTLAAIFGINEAIAIQQIHWVVSIKHEHKDDRTFYQGVMWCKYTLPQWGEKMPWLSTSSIYRLFKRLEKEEIIKTCQPYASSRDQTKWYRIDYEVFEVKSQNPSSQNDQIPSSQNDQIPSSQNDQMINTLKDLKNLKETQADVLFELDHAESRSEQKQNLQSLQITQEETPPPPTPAAPLSPENSSKAIATSKQAERYQQFEARFSQAKPNNRHVAKAFVDAGYSEWHNGKHPNDWRKSLIDVCIQRKKKRGDEATVGTATDFIFNVVSECIRLGMWTKFQNLVDKALELEAQEQRILEARTQPQQLEQPQEKLQRLPVPDFVLERVKRNRCIA